MGDGVAGWAPVIDGMAETTRTCAYDRAGRGSSEPRGRHTVADAADDLRTLLSAAGESPPFIVVGHSLGEVYARVFADRYRDEVAGLVLVDGFSVDLEADWIHPLLGDLRPEYEAASPALPRPRRRRSRDLDWPTSEEQLRATDISGLPIVVLQAPRVEPRLDGPTNERSPLPGRPHTSRCRPAGSATRSPGAPATSCRRTDPDLVIVAAARELVRVGPRRPPPPR